MALQRVLEGTWEELSVYASEWGDKKLVVIVPSDEVTEDVSLPAPPNTVRDQAHLEQMLLVGIASPTRKVTDQDWSDMRQTVRNRLAARD